MIAKKELNQKTILVCPLDWGLGHATRVVPVITEFLSYKCDVYVAAWGKPLSFLQMQFGSSVQFFGFPGKTITYPKRKAFFVQFFLQLPSFLLSIWREHQKLKTIVKTIKPDLIISDNRYGVWHKNVTSVFITHQLFIQLPRELRFLSPLANKINHWFISRFSCCWVPDFENDNGLSGVLSHGKYSGQRIFIGPLSRFEKKAITKLPVLAHLLPARFLLVILSGPEPQRTLLENHLKIVLQGHPVVFFRGLPGNNNMQKTGTYTWFDHAPDELMAYCIEKSDLVICRSGYSSIMDLRIFGKKALFIPTPGQTEQEYLAHLLEKKKQTSCLLQENIEELDKALSRARNFKGLPKGNNGGVLSKVIKLYATGRGADT